MCCVIIDGYVDEPAVLGVPPYVSTYVRYVAGAFFLKGYDVRYYTIDQVRWGSRAGNRSLSCQTPNTPSP